MSMHLSLPKPKACPDCGSDPVFHRREYWLLLIDLILVPIFSFFSDLAVSLVPHSKNRRPYLGIYELFAFFHLGSFLNEYDDKTMLLDQVLWDEAKKRNIVMREFRLFGVPTASFVAKYPDGHRISFESYPTPPGSGAGVWWLDTKSVMKKHFQKRGIPVARGGAAFTLGGARRIFNKLEAPVIVKPYEGSGSRHTTTHVMNNAQLEHAFKISQQITPLSIVEEELEGAVYRPTLVGGKLIATIRRDQPQVVGDGIHTISELVAEANKNPKRQGPYYEHLKLEEANLAELMRQNLTTKSVPAAGARIQLHQKINWSVGGTTCDVTDIVHPDNKELFEHIAHVLKAPVVGIDFIIGDISKSWKEQKRCGVIECNSRPFFDNHHLPFEGQPRNVAASVWDYAGY
jgi:D-alanine-D-alanine ligase-like ATP-grasp enzyme